MNNIKEHLDKWHPDLWGKLNDQTTDLLAIDDPNFHRSREEYAAWHEASLKTGAGYKFYEETSGDEKVEAQQELSSDQLSKNPYQLMCKLNYHILCARYEKNVKDDLRIIRERLDNDTWSSDSELQQHVICLRDAAEELECESSAASQLNAEADEMESEAEEMLQFINSLLDQ